MGDGFGLEACGRVGAGLWRLSSSRALSGELSLCDFKLEVLSWFSLG